MKGLVFPVDFEFQKTDGFGNPVAKSTKLHNSTEEIRCMLLACVVVFARHNLKPIKHKSIKVMLTNDVVRDPDEPEESWSGMAWKNQGKMIVRVYHDQDKTFTVLIHEYLHLLGYHYEWVVSTLTNRFKEEIVSIASILLGNYYKGAAHLAHANKGMAYHPESEELDGYNSEQWLRIKTTWTRKHRGKRNQSA